MTTTQTPIEIQQVPHPSIQDAPPRARRPAPAPRTSHGDWAPPTDRFDPIELLIDQGEPVPDLVPIRHGRMAASPFAFYRGAAAVMAADLAGTPATGLDGAAVRRRPPGQLRRLRLARALDGVRRQRLRRDPSRARSSGTSSGWPPASRWPARSRDFDPTAAPTIVLDVGPRLPRGHARVRRACATSTSGTPASTSTTCSAGGAARSAPAALKTFQRRSTKAESKDRLKAKAKLTHVVDGELRFLSDPPLLVPVEEVYADERPPGCRGDPARHVARLPPHAGQRPAPPAGGLPSSSHLARKVVGVGSVGTRCWVALLARPRRRRSAVPAGQGGRGLGARAAPGRRAGSPTTASAWSRASA